MKGFPSWVLGACTFVLSLQLVGPSSALGQSANSHEATDREARALFLSGDEAFAEGHFEDALRDFEHSYELSGRPELLYNMGTAADRLRLNTRALTSFRRYLEESDEVENRANVERRIEVLEERLSGEAPGPAPWVLIGVGAGLVLTGTVFTAIALGDKSAVEGAADGTEYEMLRDRAERVPLLSTIGWTGLVVGAVVATAGVLWLTLGPGPGEQNLEVGVGATALTLRGSF